MSSVPKSRGKPICVVSCDKKTGELTVNEEELLELEKNLKAAKGPNVCVRTTCISVD